MRKGDMAKADKAATEFIAALNAFQPEKVAFTCGTCLYEVGKVFPAFADVLVLGIIVPPPNLCG